MKYTIGQPSLGPHECGRVNRVIESGQLTQGPRVQEFERTLAEFLRVPHVVACSSGTTALHLALATLGVGPGDEVLVPDLTFVATANAVAYCGATPVLVDVDPVTWTIDLEEATKRLTSNTCAIIPVSVYGVPCNMLEVLAFADAHCLFVVEDAAEGFGGYVGDAACGTVGDMGTFSFYGNKIVTCGEGGAVATGSSITDGRLRFLRGQAMDARRRYFHTELGFNYRMTELQAAIGLGQMSHVGEMLHQRFELFTRYRRHLNGLGYIPEAPHTSDTIAPWLFTMQVDGGIRDALISTLEEYGVETRPTFVPLHRLPMYDMPDSEFPIASIIGETGLSFPTHAKLTVDDVDTICGLVMQAAEVLCAA